VHRFEEHIIAYLRLQHVRILKKSYFGFGKSERYQYWTNSVNMCRHKKDFHLKEELNFFETFAKGPARKKSRLSLHILMKI